MKTSVAKEKFVLIVVDYVDIRFLNFAIEYLRENEKAHETVFAFSYGARSNLLCKKKRVENLVTLPL